MAGDTLSTEEQNNLSRREFLAKAGGVAAAWGAGVAMGKIATEQQPKMAILDRMDDSLCEKAGMKLETEEAKWTTDRGNLTIEPRLFSINDGLHPAGFKVSLPVSLFEGVGYVDLKADHSEGKITSVKDLDWSQLFSYGKGGTADFYFLNGEGVNKIIQATKGNNINPQGARNLYHLSAGFEKGKIEIAFSNIVVEKTSDGKGFQPVKKDATKATGEYGLAVG
jgi:hypothetical protein